MRRKAGSATARPAPGSADAPAPTAAPDISYQVVEPGQLYALPASFTGIVFAAGSNDASLAAIGVAGTAANTGFIGLYGGYAAGTGATLTVGGSLRNDGVISLAGGAPGSGGGASLGITGTLDNAGTLGLSGGYGGSPSQPVPGGAAALNNAGTLLNSGTLIVHGGYGGRDGSTGSAAGAALSNTGVLTNTGVVDLQAGSAYVYQPATALTAPGSPYPAHPHEAGAGPARIHNARYGGEGATFTNTGVLTNSGTWLVAGRTGTATGPRGGGGATLLNDGSFLNTGHLTVQTGQFDVYADGAGTLIDAGTLTNEGTLLVDAAQYLNADHTPYYTAQLTIAAGGTLINDGSLGVSAGLTVYRNAFSYYYPGSGPTLVDSGLLTNNKLLYVSGHAYGNLPATYVHITPGATLDNSGTFFLGGGPGDGVTLNNQGTLLNEGTIATFGAVVTDAGVFTSVGTVSINGGGSDGPPYFVFPVASTLNVTGTLINEGKLYLQSSFFDAGALNVSGTFINSGSLYGRYRTDYFNQLPKVTITSTGTFETSGSTRDLLYLYNSGLFIGTGSNAHLAAYNIENAGTIVSGPSLYISNGFFDMPLSGYKGHSGSLDVSAGGTLTVYGRVAADQTFRFESAAAGRLDLGILTNYNLAAPISGFGHGDKLDIIYLPYIAGQTAASLSNGVLTVANGIDTNTFTLEGVRAGTSFAVADDQNYFMPHGVLVTEVAQCYMRGTRILTPAGPVAIEDLRIGDRLTTLHGGAKPIRWIGERRYDGRFIAGNHLMLPVCIRAGALAPNIPARDLRVSPGHGIHLDGALIPAWRLVNGLTITQASDVDEVTYLHLELDTHEIIFAEHAPAESYLDEGCRAQFHNINDHRLRYPNADSAPPRHPLRPAAGGRVHAARHRTRIAERAGLHTPLAAPGTLRGYLEVAGPDRVIGWAQDETSPEAPVCLDVLAAGHRVMRLLANRYRADVRAAGHGSGRHGFDTKLPPDTPAPIELRRATDQAVLAPVAAPAIDVARTA